ncbi:hypothetical protein DdX_17509 [Ditylenchus destructor]|uniref:Uncharacterized protein n=1 Tax=Ditylenchus destructor TaxID=166010 RepID=A0AAD4QYY1_9BILA|nr:hypothetical protein DdX_17509 [Ditylenchus destructor]
MIRGLKEELNRNLKQNEEKKAVSQNVTAYLKKFVGTVDRLLTSLQEKLDEVRELERNHVPIDRLNEHLNGKVDAWNTSTTKTTRKEVNVSETDVSRLLSNLLYEAMRSDISADDENHLITVMNLLTQLMGISAENDRIRKMFLETVEKFKNNEAKLTKQHAQEEEDHGRTKQELAAVRAKLRAEAEKNAQLRKEAERQEMRSKRLKESTLDFFMNQFREEGAATGRAERDLAKTEAELEEVQKKYDQIRQLCENPIIGTIIRLLTHKVTGETSKDAFWAAANLGLEAVGRGLEFVKKVPLSFWTFNMNTVNSQTIDSKPPPGAFPDSRDS